MSEAHHDRAAHGVAMHDAVVAVGPCGIELHGVRAGARQRAAAYKSGRPDGPHAVRQAACPGPRHRRTDGNRIEGRNLSGVAAHELDVGSHLHRPNWTPVTAAAAAAATTARPVRAAARREDCQHHRDKDCLNRAHEILPYLVRARRARNEWEETCGGGLTGDLTAALKTLRREQPPIELHCFRLRLRLELLIEQPLHPLVELLDLRPLAEPRVTGHEAAVGPFIELVAG